MGILASAQKALAGTHHYCDGAIGWFIDFGAGIGHRAFHLHVVLKDENIRPVSVLS